MLMKSRRCHRNCDVIVFRKFHKKFINLYLRRCCLDTVVRRQDSLDRDAVAWIWLFTETGQSVSRRCCLDMIYGDRTVWIETRSLGYGCTDIGQTGTSVWRPTLWDFLKKSNISQYLCNVMVAVSGVMGTELQKMRSAYCEQQAVCQPSGHTVHYVITFNNLRSAHTVYVIGVTVITANCEIFQ